MTYMTCRIHF